jgi:hypothetical protein
VKSAYTCQNELQQFLYKLMNKQNVDGEIPWIIFSVVDGRNGRYSNKTQ